MQTDTASNTFPRGPGIAWHHGFAFRRVRIPGDVPLLHRWFGEPRAHFWGMRDHTAEGVAACYQSLLDSGHAGAWLGLRDGVPAFLIECYDPAHDEIREHYRAEPGDMGMHLFVGPAAQRIRRYTHDVFTALMRFMFETLGAARIVVEPDVDNARIHALNRAMGFVYLKGRAPAHQDRLPRVLHPTRLLFPPSTRKSFDDATPGALALRREPPPDPPKSGARRTACSCARPSPNTRTN